MVYGYNDQARPLGVIHYFGSTALRLAGVPLCGKREWYLGASFDETPHCKSCVTLAAKGKVR